MADDTREIRNVEQLKIKIVEAKDLPINNHGSGNTNCRDVHCTIALDQEEICRTPTIECTQEQKDPFFNEEYQFQIPRPFRCVSVYVWARDKSSRQSKLIGKTAVNREELNKLNFYDQWFPINAVDACSEVQGKANIEFRFIGATSLLKRRSDFDDQRLSLVTLSKSNEYKENALSTSQSSGELSAKARLKAYRAIATFGGPVTGSLDGTEYQQFEGNPDIRYWKPSKRTTISGTDADKINTYLKSDGKQMIEIRVRECENLAKKNGNCDPFVVFTAVYRNKRVIKKRTKPQKRTVNPKFDEIMQFDLVLENERESRNEGSNMYSVAPLGGSEISEIIVSFWHEHLIGENIFLGEVKIPMTDAHLCETSSNGWYFLQPRISNSRTGQSNLTSSTDGKNNCDTTALGRLRLKLRYTADYVFPLATYDTLMNLMVKSVDMRPVTSSAVYLLGEVVTDKTDIAQPLVRLFTYKKLLAPMIKALADYEISTLTEPTTIFRGNSLVSKMMEETMRLTGVNYLRQTLQPVIEEILKDRAPCEIDPKKESDPAAISRNLNNLSHYVEKVFAAITQSSERCPVELCQLLHDLKDCASKHFPRNREIRYSVVSGFIFLRFFGPAILRPKLFDLTKESTDSQTDRTLMLISKTIQYVGNLVSSKTSYLPCKELFTQELYGKFSTTAYISSVQHFLDVVSTIGADPNDVQSMEPELLKEGSLGKRRGNRKNICRRTSFKQRYFRLTTHSLTYSKAKGKPVKHEVKLSEIRAVEKCKDPCFQMQNVFQIVHHDDVLYIQTSNCVEENEWIDLLNKICQSNKKRLERIHSCAYINGVWDCCKQSDHNALGCQMPTEQLNDEELSTSLQRLSALITTNRTKLEGMQKTNISGTDLVTGPISVRANIKDLLSAADNLEQICKKYKTKLDIGSQQSPFGDDNYINMKSSSSASNTNCLRLNNIYLTQ